MKISEKIDEGYDLYNITKELKYHNLKKFKSAGVMENEKTVIDEIINYKKSKNMEYDYYENNKNFIDMAISKMQTDIICGVLTLEAYKLQVKKQINYEINNLEEAKSDNNLYEDEKEKIIERINKRIEILNLELMQEVDGDEDENIQVEENQENLSNEPENGNNPKLNSIINY